MKNWQFTPETQAKWDEVTTELVAQCEEYLYHLYSREQISKMKYLAKHKPEKFKKYYKRITQATKYDFPELDDIINEITGKYEEVV